MKKNTKYHTVWTVPKYNRKITESCKMDTPSTQIHSCSRVKLFQRVLMILLHTALLFFHMHKVTCLSRNSVGPTIAIGMGSQQCIINCWRPSPKP